MGWKQVVADYFSFSRRDRIAILVLFVAVMAVILAPRFMYPKKQDAGPVTDTGWISLLRSMEKKDSSGPDQYAGSEQDLVYDRSKHQRYQKTSAELFQFDPNTLSPEGWKRLGLRPKTIATIRNFISKGGRFRQPEDLGRIYGLFPDEYARISPYVRIPSSPGSPPATNNERKEDRPQPARQARRYEPVDLNLADTAALIALPGIGSKLAGRIVSFREKLGGFYQVAQVAEVYGLHDSTYQKIRQYLKLDNPVVRKININTATVEELKAHPYIRYHLSNPIIAYRKEHGDFKKIEDLKSIMAITEEVFRKIEPYLTL